MEAGGENVIQEHRVARHCKQCTAAFQVTEIEQDWCRNQGVSLPRLCLSCRADRRGLQNETRVCGDCGGDFVYPRELALLVMTLSWEAPGFCLAACTRGTNQEAATNSSQLELVGLLEAISAPVVVSPTEASFRPTQPEDLFRSDIGTRKEETTEEPALPPEDLPSPDSLFKDLS